MCGVSVAYYKLVAERGRWPSAHNTDFLGEANKAWLREDEENNAILGWIIAGEMGIESGMNNVAFLLDKGYGADLWEGGNLKERAMRWWIRSAAQDNVDAMVKVGDLYCE
jgi:SEL1 protein